MPRLRCESVVIDALGRGEEAFVELAGELAGAVHETPVVDADAT